MFRPHRYAEPCPNLLNDSAETFDAEKLSKLLKGNSSARMRAVYWMCKYYLMSSPESKYSEFCKLILEDIKSGDFNKSKRKGKKKMKAMENIQRRYFLREAKNRIAEYAEQINLTPERIKEIILGKTSPTIEEAINIEYFIGYPAWRLLVNDLSDRYNEALKLAQTDSNSPIGKDIQKRKNRNTRIYNALRRHERLMRKTLTKENLTDKNYLMLVSGLGKGSLNEIMSRPEVYLKN